ncbi:MAG TPA: helix-turn-helix transcriptional regulator [Bacteroidota bacterium]|nr:helix-turn-helix transcriptional regulator [Bacteroidota bacterium]
MRDETSIFSSRRNPKIDGYQPDPNMFGVHLELCSPIIRMAVLRLMTDFRNNIRIENLAKDLNVHPSHLERQFKNQNDTITLKQLLIGFRLHYATFLICFENLKLNEIAEKAGFASARDLYRSFRHHLGITAAHYKQSCKFEHFKSIYDKGTRMRAARRNVEKK